MNRRQFLLKSGYTTLALSTCGSLALLEGCPVSQEQLTALVNEVGVGLQGILPYFKTVSAEAAAKIEAAFATLQTDVQNFKPGATVAVIEQAVNDFVAAMNLIPVVAQYQPLVALIVATVEGIITLLVPAPAGGTVAFARAAPEVAITREKGHVLVSYRGVTVKDPPKTAGSFRSAWNKDVKANAQLSGLALT